MLFRAEPATGLDPRSRLEVWATIEGLVAEGTTVLLPTQYLDEADRLADLIAVIDRGHVIADACRAGEEIGTSGSRQRKNQDWSNFFRALPVLCQYWLWPSDPNSDQYSRARQRRAVPFPRPLGIVGC